jgi:RNA polymerase II subunit A small phosphatase-like protein
MQHLGQLAVGQCASSTEEATALTARVVFYITVTWGLLYKGLLQVLLTLQQYVACKQQAILALYVQHTASRLAAGGIQPPTRSVAARSAPGTQQQELPAGALRRRTQQGVALLPPLPPHLHGRLTVVLDLDKTLLCTYPEHHVKETFVSGTSSTTCWLQYSTSNGVGGTAGATTLAVFLRPGAQQFLAALATFADVVLFTAASAAYAQPLARLLDPQRGVFKACLYKDATVRHAGREGVKDLSTLNRDLSRVVLIDNCPFSFLLQPTNGIPCKPYSSQPSDTHLLEVMLPLLLILADAPDVRPVLASKFGMAQWLATRCGLPAGR